MNILLATHNYYPYKFGGTEVYVASLAQYLAKLNYHVSIVAAVDDKAFDTHHSIFADENLRICSYHYENILVFGIQYSNVTTQQIYSRQSIPHQNSWNKFIASNDILKKTDLLHVNGFTPTIGLDLIYSLKKNLNTLKVVTSYHTAISCAKESLMFANTLSEQHDGVDEVADMFSYRLNVPYAFGRIISWLSPSIYLSFLPAIFNLKKLTKLIIDSFSQLNKLSDEWWVYSEGIKSHLLKKGIAEDKLIFERHGVADFFFNKERTAVPPTKFLYSGRMIKAKGFHTLLNAWLRLAESTDRVLWITGYPISDDKKTLKLIQKTAHRTDIVWLGTVDQQSISKIYLAVNTVIIPSEVYEIGPLVFHEAIASGCKVIGSDIGGCKELASYYAEQSVTFKAGNDADLSIKIFENRTGENNLHSETRILTFSKHFKNLLSKSKIYKLK